MAANQRLAHVVLQTNRKDEMCAWYCRVLGAHVVHRTDQVTFLTFDEEHHRLALIGAPIELTERTPLTVGMQHAAYTFGSLTDLLDRYVELREAGIRPHVCVAHGPTTSLYYRDPDGNLVELQIDVFATTAQVNEYLAGPEFTADPIGPAFDPERLLTDYAGGTPTTVLTGRTWALAGPEMSHPPAALGSDRPAHPVSAG
ncbi:VOC family protein [Embleya sp. NPDC020886]|uniref:VOC family protein n=1 Tax=Embleya sp. NPDC020886 TaxID=3363980 RepID=UPI0037AD6886